MKYLYSLILIISLMNCSGVQSELIIPKESRDEVVIMETTLGTIVIDLYENEAPLHSANFKKLANEDLIVDTYFHRVIPGFIVQGGDPNTKDSLRINDGLGQIPGEKIPPEFSVKHLRGYVAAARDQNPEKKSSTSQFYFCLIDLPNLDEGQYQDTVFGKVIKGMDVVDAIAKQKTDQKDNPIESVYIKSTKVVDKSEIK